MLSSEKCSGRRFVKMHGLRNHFAIVDARQESFAPSQAAIAKICDGSVGVGADELIVIEHSAGPANVFMRIYNVDGKEVEACGNATRCVAWLLMEEADSDAEDIETLAGILSCKRAGEKRVAVDMGNAELRWQKIPIAKALDTLNLGTIHGKLSNPVAVNIGNPHVVYFVDDLDAVDIEHDAQLVQADPLFPNGVNVGVAQIMDENTMRLIVYERGAGMTMACGSGACAAAVAARLRRLISRERVDILLPGGELSILLDDAQSITMLGPAEYCFNGYLPLEI